MNIYNQTISMLEDYFKSTGENIAKARIVFKDKKAVTFYSDCFGVFNYLQ